jgi:hypothetical protein
MRKRNSERRSCRHRRIGPRSGRPARKTCGTGELETPAASNPANFYASQRKSPHITGFAPAVTTRDPERLLSAPNDRQPRMNKVWRISSRYLENDGLAPRGINRSSLTRQARSLLLAPPVGLSEEAS